MGWSIDDLKLGRPVIIREGGYMYDVGGARCLHEEDT